MNKSKTDFCTGFTQTHSVLLLIGWFNVVGELDDVFDEDDEDNIGLEFDFGMKFIAQYEVLLQLDVDEPDEDKDDDDDNEVQSTELAFGITISTWLLLTAFALAIFTVLPFGLMSGESSIKASVFFKSSKANL